MIYYRISPIYLSLEKVALHTGQNVWMEVDDNILLIVFDPQGTLDQQLRPCPIHILNIKIILTNFNKLHL